MVHARENLTRTESRRVQRESLSFVRTHESVYDGGMNTDHHGDIQVSGSLKALKRVYHALDTSYTSLSDAVNNAMEGVQHVVRPLVLRLPKPATHFLGFREAGSHSLAVHQMLRSLSILLATFAVLSITGAILTYAEPFKSWGSPAIIPSFGAAAILLFNATGAPFSQPRHMVVATTISATIGIAISKLFEHNPSYERFIWVGAPIACSISSVIMDLTGTTHPPAGAASILPFIDVQLRELGWRTLVLVLVSEAVFLACALVFNNIVLRYPLFWWTATPPLHYPLVEVDDKSAETDDSPA